MRHFEISSTVASRIEDVWSHCSSMKGVSRELRPILRMTYPKGGHALGREPFVPGEPLFRSWLLLFGLIPVDRSDITFVEWDPGRRFVEKSSMATQRVWRHERVLEAVDDRTRVVDRLSWEGRFPGATLAYAVTIPVLFRWRHRRLKQLFG